MRRTDSNTVKTNLVKIGQSKHTVGKISLGLVCAGAAAISMVAAYGFLQVRPEVASQNANTQIKPLASLAGSKAEKSSDELREDAMQAYQAGQLFAPAGNNAIELYLRALSQNPSDFGAKEAVFELIPPATLALEAAINAGNSIEIARLSGLLVQADPSSTRIGALVLRGRAQIAAGIAAEELASTTLPEPRVTVDAPVAAAVRSPEALETVIANAVAPSEAVANEPREVPVAFKSVIASAPAPVLASLSPSTSLQAPVARAARGEIVDARVIKSSPPMFPVEAKRRKATGWVDLKLQVDASGKVTDAVVVESMPGRIFDAEAKRAVMRWRFSPKTVDSKAVASTVNQRITFKPEI